VSHIIKEGRRQRYIGFRIVSSTKKSPIERSEMISEMRQQCKHLFDTDCKALGIYLTRFDGKQGVVKCNHIEKERTIELLTSFSKIASHEIEIETVGTSGTIKSLVKKHMNNSL